MVGKRGQDQRGESQPVGGNDQGWRITKFNKDENIKESQKTLFSKVELGEIENAKRKPKKGKSETKISKNLDDLLS